MSFCLRGLQEPDKKTHHTLLAPVSKTKTMKNARRNASRRNSTDAAPKPANAAADLQIFTSSFTLYRRPQNSSLKKKHEKTTIRLCRIPPWKPAGTVHFLTSSLLLSLSLPTLADVTTHCPLFAIGITHPEPPYDTLLTLQIWKEPTEPADWRQRKRKEKRNQTASEATRATTAFCKN